MSNKYPLKFLQGFGLYNAGEVARFDAVTADRYVAGGIAKAYDPDEAAAEEAAASADAQALADRQAELDRREADLAAREQKVAATEKGAAPKQGQKADA